MHNIQRAPDNCLAVDTDNKTTAVDTAPKTNRNTHASATNVAMLTLTLGKALAEVRSVDRRREPPFGGRAAIAGVSDGRC